MFPEMYDIRDVYFLTAHKIIKANSMTYYFEHLLFASRFSAKLLTAAAAAMVHALVPCLFEKTASKIIADLYARTHNRGQ